MRTFSAYIQCPFYMDNSEKQIRCEGYIGGTCMITTFPSRKDMLNHISRYCTRVDGGSCIMAKNLYEKYKRLEDIEIEAAKKRLSQLRINNR